METNQEIDKYKLQSTYMLTLQNGQKRRNRTSSFEVNIKERTILTAQEMSNKQKLFDFISDKKKLSLKTYFDHRGTKAFLTGKNEAMKKIELNENIEEENVQNKNEGNLQTKKENSCKKNNKRKTVGFILNENNNSKMLSKEETITKKKNFLSTKNISDIFKSKLNTVNEKYVNFDFEEESKFTKWEPKTPVVSHKKSKKKFSKEKLKKKVKEKKVKINIDKSIDSINTVNSKLFNNEKEYEKYQNNLTKDEIPFIEEIIYQLDMNRKKVI